MTVRDPVRARLLPGHCGISEARKRVVFGQKADVRTALALTPFGHERGRNPRGTRADNREASRLELVPVQLRRLDLLEARLGELPDLVADAFDRRARRFDCSPNVDVRLPAMHGAEFSAGCTKKSDW